MRLYRLSNRKAFRIYSDKNSDYGKFINALKKSPVSFYGLAFRKDKLYGYVGVWDYKRLCALAEEHSLICEVIGKSGFFYATKKFHMRFGLLIGALLSAAMVMFLNDRVMIIEIGGNETIPDSRIISLLKDTGIYTGSKISDVDLRLAERRLMVMDKNIAWAGIKNTGSRITVEIDELTETPEMERKNTPCNIVAVRDAQIKNVRVYSGMLMPMVGDAVRKGDIIVSGVVDTKYGRSHYVHSIGEITGIYTEKMTFSQPLKAEEKVFTGECVKKAVSIFGKRFVYGSSGKAEGEYEYYETEKPLTIGKITLPIALTQMHYKLTDTSVISYTEEEAEELLHKRIAKYEQNFLTDGVTVTDKSIRKTSDNDCITFTVTYTVEGEIGEEKSFFVK